jgi:hypothetical protein
MAVDDQMMLPALSDITKFSFCRVNCAPVIASILLLQAPPLTFEAHIMSESVIFLQAVDSAMERDEIVMSMWESAKNEIAASIRKYANLGRNIAKATLLQQFCMALGIITFVCYRFQRLQYTQP